MWHKFTQGLVNFIQGLLNIFKKKDKHQDWTSITFDVVDGYCDEMHLGPGKITLLPKNVEILSINSDISDKELKELEKLFSTPKTLLPKRIKVKTLFISCYGNYEYDSTGVDLSQLEEKGIAHYWCTSTKSIEEFEDEGEWNGEEELHTVITDAWLLEFEDGSWAWDAVDWN